ncbi:DDE-type integrase/transposase/recombinase [Acidisoma cladoniae]|uniref:DDE-type integrase/transposase/recombinase n=1 Tax=Acidisoma cladoniae TaxID=3040935 RepID=UPI003D9C86F2
MAAQTGSWWVDETYIKIIRGGWTYLYRAVDSLGRTIHCLLPTWRDADSVKRFLLKRWRRSTRASSARLRLTKPG